MKKFFCLTIIFIACYCHGQIDSTKTTFNDKYKSYFELDRESIYLHLNKTTYIAGEDIWFKGYVYNRHRNIPFNESSNIYIGIYDNKGQQIQKKLYCSQNAVFSGNIVIDSTYTSGQYYVKASTNWMLNFKEDDSFVQNITIINSELKNKTLIEPVYDLQLLPEGGYLLKGTENTIGVKVIDQNGKGVGIKQGRLFDNKANLVKTFSCNHLGMGKFSFVPNNGNHKVELTLENGKSIEKILPKPKSYGINMSVTNIPNRDILISLRTNLETILKTEKKKYKIRIHRDGMSSTYELIFSDSQLENSIRIKRENLLVGINIITVFDEEDNPIIERLFFNNYGIDYPKINLEKIKQTNDSTTFTLTVDSKIKTAKNISISILPKNTKSYNQGNNIFSQFLLSPYVNGNIENPRYYFEDMDRKKEYELDLLLLTQGWSRYSWNSIFNNTIAINHKFEIGIDIEGTVTNLKGNNSEQLIIYPTKNIASKIIDLDNNNSFSLNNLYIEETDSLRISILNKKGKTYKPSVVLTEKTRIKKDIIKNIIPTYNIKIKNSIDNSEPNNNTSKISEQFLKNDVEQLDEVVLKAKINTNNGIKASEDIDISSNFISAKTQNITKYEIDMYGNSLINYIISKGYRVLYDDANRWLIVSPGPNTINGSSSPLFYIDDVVTDPRVDNRLQGYNLSNIEKILVDRTGFGYGARGSNGVIKIYTRKTPIDDYSTKRNFGEKNITTKEFNFFFTPSKKFYKPLYNTFLDDTFIKYGVLEWFKNITIDNDGKATLTISNSLVNEINLYIEGMGIEGSLISDVKSIQFN